MSASHRGPTTKTGRLAIGARALPFDATRSTRVGQSPDVGSDTQITDEVRYERHESEARWRGRDLWQDASPVPPWEWPKQARASMI